MRVDQCQFSIVNTTNETYRAEMDSGLVTALLVEQLLSISDLETHYLGQTYDCRGIRAQAWRARDVVLAEGTTATVTWYFSHPNWDFSHERASRAVLRMQVQGVTKAPDGTTDDFDLLVDVQEFEMGQPEGLLFKLPKKCQHLTFMDKVREAELGGGFVVLLVGAALVLGALAMFLICLCYLGWTRRQLKESPNQGDFNQVGEGSVDPEDASA